MTVATDLLSPFLEGDAKRLPGVLLYAKVWGSHSHGTQLPTSDVDYLAVFQRSARDLLSLHPGADTVDGKGPDFQAHELGKFLALLVKGNPGVVECLFTEEMQFSHPVWMLLRQKRRTFLNKRTLSQYIGYCRGQLHRMDVGSRLHTKGGDFNTKWAYHMIRLALDAERIAKGDEPQVRKSGDELELLMEIRAGSFTPEQLADRYKEIETRIDASSAKLRDAADEAMLNEWLWRRRAEYLE